MIFFLVFFSGLTLGTADPCTNYSTLPYADLRFVNNIYDSADVAVNDRFLDPGWYRVSDDDMPLTSPAFLSCGTTAPIWLSGGSIPPVASGEVSRTACVVVGEVACIKTYDIKVKNCVTYRVYYLIPTTGSDEGYCFGMGEPGEKPSYTPPKAEVKVGTVTNGLMVFSAKCIFEKSLEQKELYYQVTWFINGIYLTSVEPQHFSDLSGFVLDESNLQTLGRNVSCSVRARNSVGGPPGLSVKSNEQFFGIEVLTPYVHIERGKTGTIRLRPTVPIGCLIPDGTCTLNVAMYTKDNDECHGVTFGQSSCGAAIDTSNWENIIEITIASLEADNHDPFNAVFDVNLRTDNYLHHLLWSEYTLPLIKVSVADTTGLDKGACQANNDPHMVTFDQRPYDIQYAGDFILYKHTQYPIQVQARFGSCYGNANFPYCVFGVAVQAGQDVFVIDQTKSKTYADYVVCLDSALDVRLINTLHYQIYTPIGSRVDVKISSPRITIHIYPSVRDKNSTEGLCGTLTNDCPDDFKMSNGVLCADSEAKKKCEQIHGTTAYRFRPKTFSDSWLVTKVQGAVDLFNSSFDVDKLPPWDQGYRRCKCHKKDDEINTEIDCSASMVSTCPRAKRAKKKVDTCKIHKFNGKIRSRRRRSTTTNALKREMYFQRKKRAVPTAMVVMTEAEAELYCQNSLGNSKLFGLCGDVPNVNTEHAIQACIMDILISNTTDWTDSSRESLQDRCLSELQLNTTLEQNGTAGRPSIAAAIREIACPGNCTDSGICVNGTCNCLDGFGGVDCSIDLSFPPYFEELMDNGMCDKQEWACDVAMATGDDFIAEGDLKCKMEPYWIDTEGLIHTEKEEIVTADIQTFMNLFCPLTLTRRKRDTSGQSVVTNVFVEAYNVSLSNDGIHFGDLHTLFIYDSKCQTVQLSGGQQVFLLKDNYCFIDNECTDEYDINPENVCQMCDPAVSKYDWSTSTTVAECSPVAPGDESNNYLWVIGPVAGSLVAVAVIGVVIWRIKLRKVKKVGDSTLFSDSARPEQRT